MDEARKVAIAAKIGCDPNHMAPIVFRLLNALSADTPITPGDARGMSTNPEITPAVIEEYITLFCRGIQIAYQRFGHAPGNYNFSKKFIYPDGKEIPYEVMYDRKSDSVGIALKAVESYHHNRKLNLLRRDALMTDIGMTAVEGALIDGFEEGFHACEVKNPALHAEVARRQAIIDRSAFTIDSTMGSADTAYARKADEVMAAEYKRALVLEMRKQQAVRPGGPPRA